MTTPAEHTNILIVFPTFPESDTGTDLVYVFGVVWSYVKQQYHPILAQMLSFYENKYHNHDPMVIQGLRKNKQVNEGRWGIAFFQALSEGRAGLRVRVRVLENISYY